MADSLIRTQGLTKVFELGDNRVVALNNVSVEIMRGDFVAVMGPSGSGKSTFMNLIGCLDAATSGTLFIEGEMAAGLDEDARADLRNRLIGFVFQNFNLLPRTSALENVALPLLYRRGSTLAASRRLQMAAERLREVGLGARMDHHPAQLSGGQQQRVAIARALVNDPVLLLADEPTGALDSRTSIEIMALFQALNAKGITVVVVTHEPDVAGFARRHLVFKDGAVVRDEPNPQPRDAAAEFAALPPQAA